MHKETNCLPPPALPQRILLLNSPIFAVNFLKSKMMRSSSLYNRLHIKMSTKITLQIS